MKNASAFCGRGIGEVKELLRRPPMHAFWELFASLRYALLCRDFEKAEQILGASLFIGFEPSRTNDTLTEILEERG